MKLVVLLIILGVLIMLYMRKNKGTESAQGNSKAKETPTDINLKEQSQTNTPIASASASTNTDTLEAPSITEVVSSPLPETASDNDENNVSLHHDAPMIAQLDWANHHLATAQANYQASSNPKEAYLAISAVISECYKQRKSQQYLIYGYSLIDTFEHTFKLYQSYLSEHELEVPLKGAPFMQLATLAQDNGDFDKAIDLCHVAIQHDLTDGTVTGFEGRIKRITKAKEKYSA